MIPLDPLVAARAIHFAATAIAAGAIIFLHVVATPTFASADAARAFRVRVIPVVWIALATAVISGVAWLVFLAASMSGRTFAETLDRDLLRIVLSQTHFGIVSLIRLGLAAVLATFLSMSARRAQWLALAAAAALTASLAWTGHAASDSGWEGVLHLGADVLHVLAAAAWIGGLVPLAMLLNSARRGRDAMWMAAAVRATRRFSTLGLISVATLIVTGLVHYSILVGSVKALTTTEYGRLLIVKLALFALMLAVAAVNRWRLVPRLQTTSAQPDTTRQLARNSLIEIALGFAVFAVAGALGLLHPAIHFAAG